MKRNSLTDISLTNAHIASIAVAVPPYACSQTQAGEFLEKNYSGMLSSRNRSVMRKIVSHPSISKRHFAFESPECLLNEDPDDRISRFTRWSIDLSADAAISALSQAGLNVTDVCGIVVNTCTGYICPGISTYLIEKLKLPDNVRAYDLVGSGCGGAIPNLQVAQSILKDSAHGAVLSISAEICSATFQMENDLSLILSNALFGDGAAAAVLWNRPEGFELVSSASRYSTEHRDAIRYIHKRGRLYNQLSSNLAHLIKKSAAQVVNDVLEKNSLKVRDIRHWAIHTGGDKIINTIRDEIGISESRLSPIRRTLAMYGNMSSPTVWFVMREIMNEGIDKGDWCMMVTFGAGLSAHACLLKKADIAERS